MKRLIVAAISCLFIALTPALTATLVWLASFGQGFNLLDTVSHPAMGVGSTFTSIVGLVYAAVYYHDKPNPQS